MMFWCASCGSGAATPSATIASSTGTIGTATSATYSRKRARKRPSACRMSTRMSSGFATGRVSLTGGEA